MPLRPRPGSPCHRSGAVLVALPAALLASLFGCCTPQEPVTPPDPVQAARLAALHDAGVGAPMTLHPVQVLGRPDTRVAQAVGLVLEKHGMPDLAVADAAFAVPADLPWSDVPAAFGAHVREHAAHSGRWHLYGQFLGTPRTGPEEVRFVVVDGGGDVVLVDRQTPADGDFRRTAGRDPDPMGCSLLVVERLFALADWRQRPGAVKEGRFEALWRELSGAPQPAERAAMAPRLAHLRATLGEARIAVLPTVLPNGHDAAGATRLAALLSQQLGCRAVAVPSGARIAPDVDSNEQRRLWSLARGLRSAAAAHAGTADYVLVADLGVGGEGSVAWLHVAMCTTAGELVLVDLQNDQHPLLQEAPPRTLEDGERLLVRRLGALLR